MTRANSLTAKASRSWQKQIAQCFSNIFTQQQVHLFSLVFAYKFLFAILQFAEDFLVSDVVKVQYITTT